MICCSSPVVLISIDVRCALSPPLSRVPSNRLKSSCACCACMVDGAVSKRSRSGQRTPQGMRPHVKIIGPGRLPGPKGEEAIAGSKLAWREEHPPHPFSLPQSTPAPLRPAWARSSASHNHAQQDRVETWSGVRGAAGGVTHGQRGRLSGRATARSLAAEMTGGDTACFAAPMSQQTGEMRLTVGQAGPGQPLHIHPGLVEPSDPRSVVYLG